MPVSGDNKCFKIKYLHGSGDLVGKQCGKGVGKFFLPLCQLPHAVSGQWEKAETQTRRETPNGS
jgi:hypothetical protein